MKEKIPLAFKITSAVEHHWRGKGSPDTTCVLRVINYKFYLSPGYGLTPMKRKMSSACDVRTRTLQRKKAEILVHRTRADSLLLRSFSPCVTSDTMLAIRTKAGNSHVQENRGVERAREAAAEKFRPRNIDN